MYYSNDAARYERFFTADGEVCCTDDSDIFYLPLDPAQLFENGQEIQDRIAAGTRFFATGTEKEALKKLLLRVEALEQAVAVVASPDFWN